MKIQLKVNNELLNSNQMIYFLNNKFIKAYLCINKKQNGLLCLHDENTRSNNLRKKKPLI